MAKVSVAALNITMSPHPPGGYAKLLNRAKLRRAEGIFRGHRRGRIVQLANREDEDGLVRGRVATWVDIDTKKAWLNEESSLAATPEEVAKISMPPHMKPEYLPIDFFADFAHHKVFVELPVGASTVARAFREMLNTPLVNESEGKVNVTLVQDRDSLLRILAMKEIRRLKIVLTRPNPDNWDTIEHAVHEQMKRQGLDEIDVIYVGNTEGVKVDAGMTALANAALIDGSVSATGLNETGARQAESTADHPLIQSVTKNDNETADSALKRAVKKIRDTVLRR